MEFTPWQVLEHRQAADDDGAGDDGDDGDDGDGDDYAFEIVIHVLKIP